MKFGTLFIALLLAGSTAQAQIPTPTPEADPWSLDDCIRYAHEHNIQIQQQALWLPLAHPTAYALTRKDVQGYQVSPFGRQDFSTVSVKP